MTDNSRRNKEKEYIYIKLNAKEASISLGPQSRPRVGWIMFALYKWYQANKEKI